LSCFLHPVPVSDIYADLASLTGEDALLLAANEQNAAALNLRLEVLNLMLQQAVDGSGNNYEKDYLRSRIAVTEEALAL